MSCSSDDQSDKECPLCMEVLEVDDLSFYPCKCEYQICRFCWHRLRTDENGLCPACRQPYPEDPVNFKPLSTADLQKMKSEKKLKQQAEKQRISESRKHLSTYRVLQKNLVYVIGLSGRIADPEMLRKHEYFGKYGKICKVAVGTTTAGVSGQASHTAYVTYSKVDEALKAILGVQNAVVDGRVVKASLGTTKYCSSFLRCQQCFKPECMYLHDMAEPDISFTKDDMHAGKHADYERKMLENLLRQQQLLERERERAATAATAAQIPLRNNTMSNKQPPAAEQNGADNKGLPGEERKEEEKRKEDEKTTHMSASMKQSNGRSKAKAEEKAAVSTRGSAAKREKKEKAAALHATQPVEVPHSIVMPPPALSTSPPDDWTSRDDGPSCSPPPGFSIPSALRPPSTHAAPAAHTLPSSHQRSSPPAGASAPVQAAPPEWQTLLGLAPRPQSPAPHAFCDDDDLGFDPYDVSSRHLAELVEEEKRAAPPVAPPPSFRPLPSQPAYNPFPPAHTHHPHYRPFSHLHAGPETSDPHSAPSHQPPLSSLPHSMHSLDSSPLDAFRFHPLSTPAPLHSTRLTPFDLFHHTHSHPLFDQLSSPSHFSSAPPPGFSSPPSLNHSMAPPPGLGLGPPMNPPLGVSLPPRQPSSLSEWQEGLKALLPNVNVRFAADLEREEFGR